jgi:predicted ATP-binding protein involved in virulence
VTDLSRFFIQRLQLKNYRCFSELDLALHDRLTVLVAANGGGKTAILDVLAVAVHRFVDIMEGRRSYKGLEARDIRLVPSPQNNMEPVTPVRLLASADFFGHQISWSRERRSQKTAGTSSYLTDPLRLAARGLINDNHEYAEGKRSAPVFPLASYLRHWQVLGV